jgi:hypothetical protein
MIPHNIFLKTFPNYCLFFVCQFQNSKMLTYSQRFEDEVGSIQKFFLRNSVTQIDCRARSGLMLWEKFLRVFY